MFPALRRTITLAALSVAFAPATAAAQQTFTNFGMFAAALGARDVDTFDDLPAGVRSGPLARAAGSYGYTVASSAGAPFDGLFTLEDPSASGDVWLSLEDAVGSLTFTGFGTQIFGIGGAFFATDLAGAASATQLRVQATDVMGNSINELLLAPTPDAFFGVRFNHAVASLTLTAVSVDPTFFFATVNNLVLAEARAVPEPQAAWLITAGIVLVLAHAHRRRRA